jgi:hypothetical protein
MMNARNLFMLLVPGGGLEFRRRIDNRQLTDFYGRPKTGKRQIRRSEVRHRYTPFVLNLL